MLRVLVGLVKGAIVGGVVGFGLLRMGWASGTMAYLGCALVGALVGVVAGQPPWRANTIWTPVIKLVVGAIVGAGLCAVTLRLLPEASLALGELGRLELRSGAALAPLIGILYGIFVEIDDGGAKKPVPPTPKPTTPE